MALLRARVPSLVVALGILVVTADASGYVVKKTTRGELVHWEQTSVDYTIDPSVGAAVNRSVEATKAAMDGWSGTVGAPELHIAAAGPDAPKKPGYDGKNGVFFIPGGYAPAGRALAITVLTYDNASGRILDADVVFNGAYAFAVLGTPSGEIIKNGNGSHPSATDGIVHEDEPEGTAGTIYDLHHVVAHELGHSLGMNDEMERKDALMYRYSAPNDPSLREPATDDINGLAELYATRLDGRGNGCGGATVAPKKPSLLATHAAMVLTMGLLAFLVLRARRDRKARVGFVLAAASAAFALMPSISKKESGVARASEVASGHARARVVSTTTSVSAGLLKTNFELATQVCRASSCPKAARGAVWGGSIGDVRQEVGGQFAPEQGDEVDVSFAKLADALAPLSLPLPGKPQASVEEIRVITAAIAR